MRLGQYHGTKVFGGPLDCRDRQPPIYYFDRAGRPYVLLEEVGRMVERLVQLPGHVKMPPLSKSAVRDMCYSVPIETKPEGKLR
jgi:hypothetical protein